MVNSEGVPPPDKILSRWLSGIHASENNTLQILRTEVEINKLFWSLGGGNSFLRLVDSKTKGSSFLPKGKLIKNKLVKVFINE